MKFILSFLLFSSAFCINANARQLVSLDEPISAFQCVFGAPFIFGASISAGYSGIGDGIKGRFSAPKLYFGSNPGPASRLARVYGSANLITNIAEMSNSSYPHGGYGYLQMVSALRDNELRKKIESASALVTVEGFYWPAIDGDIKSSLRGLEALIFFAKTLNKPLFIGNVPIENPDNVSWLVKEAGWTSPRNDFVQKFNSTLEENCKREEECYIVDLFETVRLLNGPGLNFRGNRYFSKDFRFDGVHLTDIAVEWLMSLMLGEVQSNPPSCVD